MKTKFRNRNIYYYWEKFLSLKLCIALPLFFYYELHLINEIKTSVPWKPFLTFVYNIIFILKVKFQLLYHLQIFQLMQN